MHLDDWADEQFKCEIAQLLQEMLKNSVVAFRSTFFLKSTKNELICDLISTNDPILKELGWSYFEKVEANEVHEKLEALYFELLRESLRMLESNNADDSLILSLLKRLMACKQLCINSKFKVIVTLYNKVDSLSCIDEMLFKTLFQILQNTKSLSGTVKPALQIMLPRLAQVALQSKTCIRSPIEGLFLAWEVHRLKIFNKEFSDGIDNDADAKQKAFQDLVKKVHGLLMHQNDLSQYCKSEKFDALCDFMQHYDLRSVLGMKYALDRRMATISEPSFLSNEKKECLKLISGIITSDGIWKERFYISDAIAKLFKLKSCDESKKLLILFLTSHSCQPKYERVEFHIDLLNRDNSLYAPWALELLLILLSDHDPENYANEHYNDCTRHLLSTNSEKGLSHSIKSTILIGYLQQLERMKRWDEVITIFMAQPNIFQCWTSCSANIFINALSNSLAHLNSHLSEMQKIMARQLLKELPLNLMLSQKSSVALGSLFHQFQSNCSQNKNYVEAFHWSDKLIYMGDMSKDEIERALELLDKLVENENFAEAKILVSNLYLIEGNPNTWLKIFDILIKARQITNCVELFEKHNILPGSDEKLFGPQWQAKIPEMLDQCLKLVNAGPDHFLQSQGLFEITHQLFSRCKPEASYWLGHIKEIVPLAPKRVVEKVLDFLAAQNEKGIDFSHDDKVFCWNLVLDRLAKLKSMKFLHPMDWWPKAWNEFSSESKDSQAQLVHSLVNGSAEAISPQLVPSLNEQELLTEVVSGLNKVLEILDSEEIKPFLNPKEELVNYTLNLNFSKICWFSEVSERKSNALLCLLETFMLLGDDPEGERQGVLLFNNYMQTNHKYTKQKDIATVINLMQRVKKSGYFPIADHYGTLRVLKSISVKKHSLEIGIENTPIENFYTGLRPHILKCICINIRSILKISNENADIKQTEKDLIRWGMDELYKSGVFFGWELASRSLEKNIIPLYLDKARITKLIDYKKFLQGCGTTIKLLHFYERIIAHKDSVIAPHERRQFLNLNGLGFRFELQRFEKKALNKTFNSALFLAGFVATFVTIYFFFAKVNNRVTYGSHENR